MDMLEQVRIAIDERYTIAVSKDHNKGLVVQVARMNPSHVSTDKGAVYKGHQPVVIWQKIIPLGTVDKTSNNIDFKDNNVIEKSLSDAIIEAQSVASKSAVKEKFIDTLLTKLDASVNK